MVSIPGDHPRAMAIVTAIQHGDTDSVARQLRADPGLAKARITDEHGVSRTLLHVVADWPGHFPNGARIVALIATAGADLNAGVINPAPHGAPETPLHWAASSDDIDVLDALLDHGADIEAPGAIFTNGTAMSDAVIFAQWRAARRLLERGARTTLSQAAALGLLNRVRECCAEQPAPDEHTLTAALWHACRGGQRDTAEYLLERGADLNWISFDHKTPLDAAYDFAATDLIAWLRAHGATRANEGLRSEFGLS